MLCIQMQGVANESGVREVKELKEVVKKSLIQQVELLNQTTVPQVSAMCCENIYALVAVLDAIQKDCSK